MIKIVDITPFRIFIGYDAKESVTMHVLIHSIITRASRPVTIVPLVREHLSDVFTRERTPSETTAFSMTRFIVPYLSDYEGWSLFMDCDMLMRTDICSIFDEVASQLLADVYVCQHDYVPKTATKATGAQTVYPRKNWSSFMLFNNDRCRMLTPDYVNHAPASDLHRLTWADRIGSLPLEWNWLVGEYERNSVAKNLHYTLGTPCFADYASCDHSDEWLSEMKQMEYPIIL
jgi:hypothetical protein